MKKTTSSIILLMCLGLFMASCSKSRVEPSGSISTQQKLVSDFNGLDVSSAFTVYVNFSNTEERVEIEANENLHEYIIVEKVGRNLVIRLRNNTSIKGDAILRAYVTTSNINFFEASGACSVFVQDTVFANNVNIDLSGASSLDAILQSNQISTDLSGASHVYLSGITQNLEADLSGASSLRDYALEVNDNLNIDLSGASNARLTANGNIYVEASGASSLYYRGSGTIQQMDLSGASQVQKK